MSKKERDEPYVWKYYRYSTGVACGRYAPRSPGGMAPQDDLLIGLYTKTGGCRYEFQVAEHHLSRATIAVRVFNDSFAVFDELPSFFVFLTTRRPTTLDAVELWCQENRMMNGITGKRKR